MPNELPEVPKDGGREDGGDHRSVNINELHLHANDLHALARLAEVDPALAKAVVDQKDREDARDHASFRFGLVVTTVLALGILGAASIVVIKYGVLAAIVLILFIIAVALLIRVLLTGEWSETTWLGKGVEAIVTLLGGKPKKDD